MTQKMLAHFRKLTISQYGAALQTLEDCVDECPNEQWVGKVANHSFNESAFHALFFADVYLSKNLDELKEQEFHKQHAAEFGDYEELESKIPENAYTKEFVKGYLDFCRNKVETLIANETEDELFAKSDIPWQEISRAELHTYNIRHLQHHAAQLIMRLRLDTQVDVGWVRTG